MKNIFLFLFFFSGIVIAQNHDNDKVEYLDFNEKPTSKANAVYYEFTTAYKEGIWKYQKFFISSSTKAFLVEKYYFDGKGHKQGKYKSYFENGFIRTEGIYLNDMKSGQWKSYIKHKDSLNSSTHPSKLGRIETYKNDKRDGIFKQYYYNGIIKTEGTYKNGKNYSVCKWYYRSGKISSKEEYDENGKIISSIMWYEDGTLSEEKQLILSNSKPLKIDIQKYVLNHFNKNLYKLYNFGNGKIIVGMQLTEEAELKILSVLRNGFIPEAFENEIRKWTLKYAEKDLEPVRYHNLPIEDLFKISFSFKGKK